MRGCRVAGTWNHVSNCNAQASLKTMVRLAGRRARGALLGSPMLMMMVRQKTSAWTVGSMVQCPSLSSFIHRFCVLLLQKGLCLTEVREKCRAGYKAQPLSSSSNKLARWLYTQGSAAKIRWCYADMASGPACKQAKQMY